MHIIRRLRKTYYIPGSDAMFWPDRAKRIFLRRVPSFPRNVLIETRTGCNGACVFCPQREGAANLPHGAMRDDLFEKIIEEIARHGTTRRISPFLTNEPFLDKTILEKCRYIKKRVPSGKVVITTNGGLLNREVADNIVRDNPFHAICISMQGIEKEPYEQSMRGSLVFEETKENVEYLIDQRDRYLPHLRIMVTMVKTRLIDADAAVRYWKSRGVSSQYTVLENRAGNLSAFETLTAGGKRVYRDCTRLFKTACITFDGDMVLCCTDYYRKMVLGNVREQSISEVWNSPGTVEIRKNFIRGILNPLCARCYVAEQD